MTGGLLTKPLSRVILELKRLSIRKVSEFKCHVVAGGNSLLYKEKYMKAHAPTMSFSLHSDFLYLALAEYKSISQVDIKIIFLKCLSRRGYLGPISNMHPDRSPGMYKLVKAIHGLKPAYLMWHKGLYQDLKNQDFGSFQVLHAYSAMKYSTRETYALSYR